MSSNSLNGIRLERAFGATERGTLWRGSRQQSGDRIVRLIDTRLCDGRFKHALSDLRANPQPRTMPIVSDGFAGDQLYVEYVTAGRWETLESYFERKHWRYRLQAVQQICEVFSQWDIHPVGLHECSIIMVKDANRWFPWLLPCPPLKYSSPYDLCGIHPGVLSSLAPEIVRDIEGDTRVRDSYALGNLALHALGIRESRLAMTDEERLEAQACGALLSLDLKAVGILQTSEVEAFLHSAEALKRLLFVIRHYLQTTPEARPLSPTELQESCAHVLATTDPLHLATELVQRGSSREALRILEWGRDTFDDDFQNRSLAVEICKKLEDFPLAVQHLDRMVEMVDSKGSGAIQDFQLRLELCQQRCGLAWPSYEALPPLAAGELDPQGDRLLKDLNWLKANDSDSRDTNMPYLRAAMIYRRRQNLTSAAQELFQAAQLEQTDMEALFLYGECLKELGEQEAVAQLHQEAHRRIENMTLAEMIHPAEAQLWRENFDTLLQP
jgi:tetratricopeptide (TPR) repeat protein